MLVADMAHSHLEKALQFYATRLHALLLDALRPERASGPLPEPELSPDEMVEVLKTNSAGRRLAPHKTATITVRP
jgi:hypothetical protein